MYLNIQWKIHLLRLIMFMYGYILLCIHIVNHGRYQTLISSPISPPFCYVFPWRLQCRNQFGVTYECTFFQNNRSWLIFAFSPISFLLSNVCLWRMYVTLTKMVLHSLLWKGEPNLLMNSTYFDFYCLFRIATWLWVQSLMLSTWTHLST